MCYYLNVQFQGQRVKYPKRIQCSVQAIKFQDMQIHCQLCCLLGLIVFNKLSSKFLSIYVSITVWQMRFALKSSYGFMNWSSSKIIRKRKRKIFIDRTRTIAGRLLPAVSLLNYSFFTPVRNIYIYRALKTGSAPPHMNWCTFRVALLSNSLSCDSQ